MKLVSTAMSFSIMFALVACVDAPLPDSVSRAELQDLDGAMIPEIVEAESAPYCYTAASLSTYAENSCGCMLGCGVSCSRDSSSPGYWYCNCDVSKPVQTDCGLTPYLD